MGAGGLEQQRQRLCPFPIFQPNPMEPSASRNYGPQGGGEKRYFSLFTRRLLVVMVLVVLALLAWQLARVLLLAFFGVLLAVIFRGSANRLSAHTPLPPKGALAVVVLALAALLALGTWLLGQQVAAEVSGLSLQLPALPDAMRRLPGGSTLADHLPEKLGSLGGSGLFSRVTGTVSTAFSFLTDALVVLFAGLFFALDPEKYRDGLVALLPHARRARARTVLRKTGHALWSWLIAQLISMSAVGVLTYVGLLLLGMPSALALGLLAGLCEFVPFFGPFLALVPAALLALTQSPSMALYVVLLYLGIQQVESNLLTPFVQQHETALPPAITLFAAVAFGLLFGPLGVVVATPLAVVLMTLVKLLYVEDVLGDDVSMPD